MSRDQRRREGEDRNYELGQISRVNLIKFLASWILAYNTTVQILYDAQGTEVCQYNFQLLIDAAEWEKCDSNARAACLRLH
jgi:hypothetical protein